MLSGRCWSVTGVGQCRVVLPALASLSAIDTDWKSRRKETDVHLWEWADIAVGAKDLFAIRTELGVTVGLWMSGAGAISLPSGRFYRLDFLEVDPDLRGGDLGYLAFAMVVARAEELGCAGIVLAAYQDNVQVYLNFNGKMGPIRGWQVPEGLVPFEFSGDALIPFKELCK